MLSLRSQGALLALFAAAAVLLTGCPPPAQTLPPCASNAECSAAGDELVIVARRAIAAGDEITIDYTNGGAQELWF